MSANTLRDDRALERGAMIAGRFRLVQKRGHGGMGSVYEAEDTVIGRTVAVKLLHVTNAIAIERFEREARAASRVSSRHVAAVYDFGRDPQHGLYMVMEHLSGDTLDRVIAREGALLPSQAAAIGAEIAEALYAAHRAGVVHRDLKPSNVMMLAEGGLKVLDFGIARMLAPEIRQAPSTTGPDTIVGTPAYISPENVAGKPVGPSADLYSLGVVLFELVTGQPPFVDDVPAALLTKHLRERAPSVASVRPDLALPEGMAALIARLLEKDPADRPSSARSVADALRSMTDIDGPVRLGSGVHVTTTGSLRRKKRRAAIGIGAAILVLVSIAIGTTLALYEDDPQPIVVSQLPSEAPVIIEPAPAPSPSPATVEIAVITDPERATLALDGLEIASPIELPQSDEEHELTVSAPGYATATRSFRADRDQSIEIVLRRIRREARPVKLRGW